MTTGSAFKDALKSIGATNTFWAYKSTSKQKKKDQIKGLNWWIADGIMTFEGADGRVASVRIGDTDKDYQVCGFLDKVALQLIRQIGNSVKVDVTLEDNHLMFRESHERMVLYTRFKLYEPVANGHYMQEAA